MNVEFEGKKFSLPDDFSDEEVAKVLQREQSATWWKTLGAIPGTTLGQIKQTVGGMLQNIAETDYESAIEAERGGARATSAKPQFEVNTGAQKLGQEIYAAGEKNIEDVHPGEMSFWQRAVLQGTSSAATQVPALALSLAAKSPVPSLAAAGGMSYGSTYGESRKKGSDPFSASVHAGIDATAEAVLELLPTEFMLKEASGPVLRLITGTMLREVPTEVLTTAIESANARLRDSKLEGKPVSWEGYGQDLLDTVGATMVSAPMLAGAAGAMRRLERKPAAEPKPREEPTGSITPDNSPQQFDEPTPPVTSAQVNEIDALIASIDADTISDKQVEEAQAVVKQYEKERKAPSTPENEAAWAAVLSAPRDTQDVSEAQFGATQKQAANAPNYVNPNQGDRMDRPFLYGPEGVVGLTPRQTALQAGTYTLGVPSEDRSAEYLKAVHDTVEEWRQKWLPNATIVVSNEGLFNNTAIGWHYSLGANQHLIVPAVIRSPTKGLGAFNVNTQASAFFNLTHEVGHALVLDRFFSEMDQQIAQQIQNESRLGTVSEALLSKIPEQQQAVIREFNAIKQGMADGTLTAQQFVEKWFSPGKLGQKNLLEDLKVAPDDSAMAVAKAIARAASRRVNVNEPVKLKAVREQALANFLSLDEYLAEQTARYAYKAKLDESSPLGKFFKNALASLRNFFISLKKEGVIAPGTAFTEWIEGLSTGDRGLTEGERIASGKKKGGKPKAKGAVAKPSTVAVVKGKPKAAPKNKVKKVQHNVETDTDLETQVRLSKAMDELVQAGVMPEQVAARLQKLLDTKDYDHFIDEFQKYAAKNVKFQLDEIPEADRAIHERLSVLKAGISEENAMDPATRAAAARHWKESGFRSPFFKAWFGDWENDPQNASKIRKGAGVVMPGTMNATIIDTDKRIHAGSAPFGGEPLVVFHATQGAKPGISFKKERDAFDRFTKGDLGFHFGTVRAAHIRTGFEASDDPFLASDEDMSSIQVNMKSGVARQMGTYVIPAVLNIRNPLYIGDEMTHIWADPTSMAFFLNEGFISIPERQRLVRAIEQWGTALRDKYGAAVGSGFKTYEWFQPVREMLMSKGYDGMIYRNTVEGDISFVAFAPNQVKSLLGSRTFSQSDMLHLELDLDGAKEGSWGVRRMWDGLKNFTSDFPRLRRATRKIQNAVYHTLELQQLSHLNPDLEELPFMTEKNGEYNRYKARLQARADAVLSDWNGLGKENWTKLNKFLLAELEGGQLWWDLKKTQVTRDGRPTVWYKYEPSALSAQKATEFGLDEDVAALALEVKNVLLDQLNEAELALLSLLGKRYANADAKVLTAAIIPVKRHIQQLRKQVFFPQGRFGNRVLLIEKEKASGPGYEVVWREHFEDPVEWEKAWKNALAKAAPDERVRKEELTDQSYVLMALPTDFVDLAASELGLSDEQLEILMSILQPVKRERVLSAYDQERLKVKGYSTDAMRSFANFTWHNANLLAKLIYRADFNWAIRGIGSRLREAKYSVDDESLREVERLQRVKTFMEKTRDYVMAPPNEAQMLRAAVSIGYLGLNVKTALLNTYGLITTWSDLTSRLGQIEGNKLFLKASKDTFASLKLTSLNERRAGDYLSPDKQKALDQAIEEGVLSQSYAYHLAGMANAGNLYRLPARQAVGRVAQHSIDAAMYLFRLTELSTRRATFLAQFEAARKNPQLSFEEAYREAVTRTNKLQNDYSLGNRVPFMRGIKASHENIVGKVFEPVVPLATVFMSFAQHMAFHAYGGYELGERRMAQQLGETPRRVFGGYTMKLWIITLLLAGYEGLPGAENLLDLLEIAWRKWGGGKSIRQELREMVQALEIDPQLAAHGFGHNVAGYDISRSIGFGRMVPGTDSLAHNTSKDSVAEMTGTLMLDLAGPTGGFIKFGLEALAGNKPRAEAFEKLPGGAGNIYVGYRWSQQGVRSPTGAQITFDLQTGELRDLTAEEIAGKMLGFNPTIVSQNRQIRFDQYDRKVYWQNRRSMLVEDFDRARWQRDREAEADAKKAIVEYNASVPAEHKELRITGADLIKSLQARQRVRSLEEKQVAPQRRYRGIYNEVKESYDQP